MSFSKQIRATVSTLLGAWVLLVSCAAYSPGLHGWIHGQQEEDTSGTCPCHQHDDSEKPENPGDPGHSCAVTLFSLGFDADVPELTPKLAINELWIPHTQDRRLAGFAETVRKPARAPPLA